MLLRISPILLLLGLLMPAPQAQAACTDKTFLDPINDVVWDCVFPITIMGVPLDFGDHPPDNPDSTILCECPGRGIYGLGFMVSFWEPARMIETTADPWCFPALGLETGSGGWGYSGGGTLGREAHNSFQNYHYYIMPLWAMMQLFTDLGCDNAAGQFDLAMVSEMRPEWSDDLYALQLFPETSLMANVATVLACAIDAVAATVERPIDVLYWCMGAWGTTYPATGNTTARDYVEANANTAGKAMFLQARTALLPDRAVNFCSTTPMPIWIKSHWRLQQTDPAVDKKCHAIGHPGLLWTHRKNPIGKQDNFAWLLFRKVRCCVVVF